MNLLITPMIGVIRYGNTHLAKVLAVTTLRARFIGNGIRLKK